MNEQTISRIPQLIKQSFLGIQILECPFSDIMEKYSLGKICIPMKILEKKQ